MEQSYGDRGSVLARSSSENHGHVVLGERERYNGYHGGRDRFQVNFQAGDL